LRVHIHITSFSLKLSYGQISESVTLLKGCNHLSGKNTPAYCGHSSLKKKM
jgi:hypothetical protein